MQREIFRVTHEAGSFVEDNFLHGFAAHLSVHKKTRYAHKYGRERKKSSATQAGIKACPCSCMVEENLWCTTQKTDDNTIIQCSLILYYLEATYRFEMFNWLFVIPKIRIPNSSEVVLSSKPLHKSTDKSYQPALLEPTEKKNELWLASEEKARFSYELSPLTVLEQMW